MTIKKWFVGLVLTVVMVSALLFSALLFSARDFQFGLAKIEPESSGLIDFDQVLAADAQIKTIENSVGPQRGELASVEQRIDEINRAAQEKQAKLDTARTAIAGQVAEIETSASVAVAESAASDLSANALSQRIASLAARSNLSAGAQLHVAALRSEVQHLAALEDEVDDQGAATRELETRQRQLGEQLGDSISRINAQKLSVVNNPDSFDRVINEVRALKQMSPLGWGAALAQGHPALLSTFLVLQMGALGAILYLFPAYMSRPEPVLFAEIAVRLIFGMCTALAFYVIANATLAGFSLSPGASQASTAATLNPFTVSLIGIVAGVMADDIARWIKNRGAEVLGASPGTPLSAQQAAPASVPAASRAEPDFTGPNPHGGPGVP
jgi:hypothetical protein